jgi:pimeloyl-ACP methyl ester carboxylesterase
MILRSAFSSAEDFIQADKTYLSLLLGWDAQLQKDFQQLQKLAPSDVTVAFLDWTQNQMYSYFGRMSIPSTVAQVLAKVQSGDLDGARALVPPAPWVMPPMTRAIVCQEIFHAPPADSAFHLFHNQFQACSEFAPYYDYFNYTNTLQHITAKTMIVGGRFDHVTPAVAMEKMAMVIPNVFLYIDPHLGHQFTQKRDCYENLILSFLSDQPTSSLTDITQSAACTTTPPQATSDVAPVVE